MYSTNVYKTLIPISHKMETHILFMLPSRDVVLLLVTRCARFARNKLKMETHILFMLPSRDGAEMLCYCCVTRCARFARNKLKI